MGPGPGMSLDCVFSAWPSCGTVLKQRSSLGTQQKTSQTDLEQAEAVPIHFDEPVVVVWG